MAALDAFEKKKTAFMYLETIGLIDTNQNRDIIDIIKGHKTVVKCDVSSLNIDEGECTKEENA